MGSPFKNQVDFIALIREKTKFDALKSPKSTKHNTLILVLWKTQTSPLKKMPRNCQKTY